MAWADATLDEIRTTERLHGISVCRHISQPRGLREAANTSLKRAPLQHGCPLQVDVCRRGFDNLCPTDGGPRQRAVTPHQPISTVSGPANAEMETGFPHCEPIFPHTLHRSLIA
jgi:hypothetical protein